MNRAQSSAAVVQADGVLSLCKEKPAREERAGQLAECRKDDERVGKYAGKQQDKDQDWQCEAKHHREHAQLRRPVPTDFEDHFGHQIVGAGMRGFEKAMRSPSKLYKLTK